MTTTKLPSRWCRPRPGILKLNTDALVRPGAGYVGLGGFFGNSDGCVVAAGTQRICGLVN